MGFPRQFQSSSPPRLYSLPTKPLRVLHQLRIRDLGQVLTPQAPFQPHQLRGQGLHWAACLRTPGSALGLHQTSWRCSSGHNWDSIPVRIVPFFWSAAPAQAGCRSGQLAQGDSLNPSKCGRTPRSCVAPSKRLPSLGLVSGMPLLVNKMLNKTMESLKLCDRRGLGARRTKLRDLSLK